MTAKFGRFRRAGPVRARTGLLLALVLSGAVGCASAGTPAGTSHAPDAPTAVSAALFRDITAEAGLDFVHDNGMSGRQYFVEMMGAGGALFDADGDGDLDAYLVQGAPLVAEDASGTTAPADEAPPGGRLYRNDTAPGADGKAKVRFTDVTAASGIRDTGYGMGAAAADYDNDGAIDLYLANWGANQLWRNRGDGSFENVTAQAGVADPRWSVGASWLDFDRDGWLDLAVANYNQYSLAADHPCYDQHSGRRDYCGPTAYPAEPSTLYRNRGDGSFEDVTATSGLGGSYGPALGIVAADLSRDGWPDLLIANDAAPNTLWVNDGGQRFRDEAMERGVAVNRVGATEANMGVVASDLDDDCDDDVFITHLDDEMNTLWVNQGDGFFEDRTPASGLGPPSLPFTGFGVADLDYDNDGLPDLFVANGAVKVIAEQAAAGSELPLAQTNQLFHNLGGGKFADVTAQAGDFISAPRAGRGVARGDVDNDGDSDLLVTSNHGPAQLLQNELGQASPWLGLRLVGGDAGRDMLGAELVLTLADGRRICRRVSPDGSYASSSDPRVLFGLAGAAAPSSLLVRWPDGAREQFDAPAPGAYHSLRQGSGRPAGAE